MTVSFSSMITLPSSSAKGLYSCWNAYSRVASPASSCSLSPPISPPSSPSRMLGLPSGSANGSYSSRKRCTSAASPIRSGSLSPPMSRASSPLQAIGKVFAQRASWPVVPPLPPSDRQSSDSESPSTGSMVTTSVSISYSVKSINSRKSRLAVRYPRPVRPQQRFSGAESIPESAGASLESLSSLSSRPVSLSMSLQRNLASIAENEQVADAMGALSLLFDSFPGDPFTIERRLSTAWEVLLKLKDYEEKHATPNLRATTIFADTLLCVHSEIIKTHSVGAQELIQPCIELNKAFEDAYKLLYSSGMIPPAPEQIPALDADRFKNLIVTIIQLVGLIRALESLADSLAMLAVAKGSNTAHKPDILDDDVILNVPGWRKRNESTLALPRAAAATSEKPVDTSLRLLLVTRNEELEQELRNLRFLLWRVSPKAKAGLGNVVKQMLPLHHEELMKSPVDDFVVDWQAAVVPSGHDGMNDQTVDNEVDTDSL